MEPLGKKLQEARLRKKISLEEASRVTKIRASRIQEIENDDFTAFSSLAYAKGFILIYGKYLDVDVTGYLEAFETSREVSVDGYSYLQESPSSAPPPLVRRRPRKRPTLLPFIIAVGVLVLGLYLIRLLLNIQRIAPRSSGPIAVETATPTPSPTAVEDIVAPRAEPVESMPPGEAPVTNTPAAIPVSPSPTEPEVRRAQPVHPEELASPSPNEDASAINQVEITPVRQTYLRVHVDGNAQAAFDDWFDSSHAPLSFRGRHFTIRVLDRGAVQIKKNGAALAAGDADITFE
jgi:cytoskeletal protein RodZ